MTPEERADDLGISLDDAVTARFNRRYLTAREVAAQGHIDVDQWTPGELELCKDEMRGMLTARLRGIVYAEDYARDVKTVPVNVHRTVTQTPTVTVSTPGPRIWWAPWRRRPDIVHHKKITVSVYVDETVQVDITRIAWAKLPDAPPFPERLGKPVTFVEYEGTQHHDR